MRLSNTTTALVLGMLGLVQAHTVLKYAYVNGKSEGVGTCIRSEHEGNNKPVEDVTSNDMACGFDGANGVARVCPANAGDDLTFEWYHANSPEFPEIYLHEGHAGPCSFMMKKVDSAVNDTGTGDGWFRIGYEGYNNQTGKWCTQRVAAGGRLTVKIPQDLAGGSYLIRPELVALHNTKVAPQLYISCFQVFLNSAGTATPKDTVAIPGDAYVTQNSKAMTWNLYDGDQSLYPDYGPPTYVSSGEVDANAQPTSKQTEGLRKENCIMETHSFCAVEVPKYSTTDECWKSTDNCWAQSDVCWKSTPLDNSPCKAWAKKCDGLTQSCQSGNSEGLVSGPPNEGKRIETEKPPILSQIPPPLDTLGNAPPSLSGQAVVSGGMAIQDFSSPSTAGPEAASAPSAAADSYGSGSASSVEAASSSSPAAESSNGGSSGGTTTTSSSSSMATGGSDYGSSSSNTASPDSISEAPKPEALSPTTTSGPLDAKFTSTCTEIETEVLTDTVIETVIVTAAATPKANRARRRHVGRKPHH